MPTAAAVCLGAVATGAFEAITAHGPIDALATIGFVAMIALPVFAVVALVGRALVAAWQPRAAIAYFVEDNGAAPALAGWIVAAGLGLASLGGSLFVSTVVLGANTPFKPLTVGFASGAVTAIAALLIVAVTLPLARLFTRVARAVDRRGVLRPRTILVATAVVLLAGGYALWRLAVAPRLGPLELGGFVAPVIGLVVVGVGHVVVRRRRLVGALAALVIAAALGTAAYARLADPMLTLAIWGERPVAGFAVDHLFDLDAIRNNVTLAMFRPTATAGAAHPDIVLVTIDTVRADHTPPYGGKADMPVLSSLASRGATFEWAFSPSNVTRRSIPSMVIGLAPNRLHGRVVGWALRVDPRYVLLAERLHAAGYDTAGFMCCYGFWAPEVHTGLQRGLEHIELEPNGHQLAKLARSWIGARELRTPGKPLFVWMHILEPHNWTATTGEPHNDDERQRFYDRALQQADSMVAELLTSFGDRRPEQAPIVIVTADHGEALGDHGQPFHSTDLYDSQTHVPLVIAGPGIEHVRIPETVSLVDLVPTIVQLAGFEAPSGPSIDGRSLAELATGRRAPDPEGGVAFAAMIRDRSNPGGVVAIVHGRWKLIDNDGREELYDVHLDPSEKQNLIADPRGAAVLPELRALLHERVAAGDRSPF